METRSEELSGDPMQQTYLEKNDEVYVKELPATRDSCLEMVGYLSLVDKYRPQVHTHIHTHT